MIQSRWSESSVVGIVVCTLPGGYLVDGAGTMTSNPERVDFTVQVRAGDEELFLEWFEVAWGYPIVSYSREPSAVLEFSNLGSTDRPISVGEVIEVTFSQFFEAWLDLRAAYERNELRIQCNDALLQLGLPVAD